VSTATLSGTRPVQGAGRAAIAGGAGALAFMAVGTRLGPLAAVVAVLAIVFAVYLLEHAGWAVAVCALAMILAESDPGWGVPVLTRLYAATPAKLSYFQLLELLAVAAVVLSAVRPTVGFRSLAPFGLPLFLVGLALAFGITYGRFGGSQEQYQVLSTLQTGAPLVVFPFVIVNVVRTRAQLVAVLGAVALLVLVKAIAGLVVVFGGLGAVQEDVGRLTYYAPASNFLLMLFLLAMLAATLARVPTSRLARWTVPLAYACLLLSYRRTFWLATIACLLLVLLLGSGRELRRLLPFLAVIVIATGYIVYTSGYIGDGGGEIVKRAQSLSPEKVTRNTQDRYRIAERRNILLALEREPLTGLGVGVSWPTRYPLPFEEEGLNTYAHMGLLWWWMKAGLLGGLAYLAVIGSVLYAGIRVWRRHPDPHVRVWALAAGVGALGYLIVELASSILGPDERGTALLGTVIGLLAVAYGDLRQPEEVPA